MPNETESSTAPSPDPGSGTTSEPAPRWRRIVAVVLVVLAAILAPLTVTAVWLKDRILSTDGYVSTVTPLVDDPAVTDALANRIVTELFAATDLEDRVTSALPGPTQVLGPALTGSLQDLATTTTERFLESDTFETLWIRANTVAHDQVVALFSGKGKNTALTQQGDAIVLDLGAVADAVRDKLVDEGVGVLKQVPIPEGSIEVTLLKSDLIPQLQSLFNLLDDLAVVLPILFLATVVAAIAVAPRRRRIVVALGLAVAGTTALLSVGVDLGRRITVDQADQASLDTEATKAVYDTLVTALRDWSWLVIAAALLVVVVALVSSPGWIGRIAERLRGSSPDVPPVAVWVRTHRGALSSGVIGLALVVLVVWPTPTPLVFAIAVVLVALALAIVTALARMQARSELTSPESPARP
ncbi:MAG: hypothetical protein ACKOA9_09320 [Actinomycetota bacterium]